MDETTQKLVNEALTSAAQGALSEKAEAIHILNEGLSKVTERTSALNERLGNAQLENIQLINQVNSLQRDLNAERQKNRELLNRVISYQALLKRPLAEIAEHDSNFKETYDKEMEVLADWMVSQKAFKELSIVFGGRLGIDCEEVIRRGTEEGKIQVLSCTNQPSHNTNANDSPWLLSKIPALLENIERLRQSNPSESLVEMALHKKMVEQGIFVGVGRTFDRDVDFFEYCSSPDRCSDSQALYNLAICYRDGIGTENNLPLFEATLEQAARIGSGDACYLLYCDQAAPEFWPEFTYVELGQDALEGEEKEVFSLLLRAVELGCKAAVQRMDDLESRRKEA